jgi:GTP:adenosylcobinamide-phosphate guanylyltransferase
MHAVISAGGYPKPDESHYPITQGGNKALIDLGGKPMVQWILDALNGCQRIEQVILVGLPEGVKLQCRHPLTRVDNRGDLFENVRAGAETLLRLDPSAEISLLLPADVPAITSNMVDWMIDHIKGQPYDIFYSVVERSVMEKRYPQSKRTYTRLKDIEICGGDVHAFRPPIAVQDNPLWERILAARKNPLKQASLVGLDTLFLLLTRQMTLEELAAFISRKLGMRGQVVLLPYAEMGMDVDKDFQLEIMRTELLKRAN